jgi:hypothetical protein
VIINYRAKYTATNMHDAVAQATARWQTLVGDPKAKLPWGATISITDENGDKEVELSVSTDHSNEATA